MSHNHTLTIQTKSKYLIDITSNINHLLNNNSTDKKIKNSMQYNVMITSSSYHKFIDKFKL